MKLYYVPGACSMAPHIVALEVGQKLDLVRVDLATKTTDRGEDYVLINPKGYVPALVLDTGDVITEVAVICQYIADQHPQSGVISPPRSLQRYQEMSALNFVATEVHKQVGALFNPAMTPEMRAVQMATIGRRLQTLEAMLKDNAYLLGDHFTVADAYLFTALSWTRYLNIDLAPWPALATYLDRMHDRATVRKAMHEEGLLPQ